MQKKNLATLQIAAITVWSFIYKFFIQENRSEQRIGESKTAKIMLSKIIDIAINLNIFFPGKIQFLNTFGWRMQKKLDFEHITAYSEINQLLKIKPLYMFVLFYTIINLQLFLDAIFINFFT